MDEPLSNLDAKLRVQMRADIAKLQHDLGTTTIYVTHDQVEAMTMGDRVAVMSLGVLQQVDTPQRLYDDPGEPVRRRLHRHAADEPARGGRLDAERHGRRSTLGGPAPRALRRGVEAVPGRRGYGGRSVVFGVRSEDLYPGGGASRRCRRSTPSLQLLEALGSHTMAYFKIDAEAIRAGAGGVEDEARGRGRRRGRDGGAAEPRRVVPGRGGARGSGSSTTCRSRSTSANVHLFDCGDG